MNGFNCLKTAEPLQKDGLLLTTKVALQQNCMRHIYKKLSQIQD